jgi:hypothetical protein
VRLYKLTGPGGETRGGFHWPLPTADGPGEWVDLRPRAREALTGEDLCTDRVLHLTDAEHLLDWADAELWEAEADESRGIVRGRDKVGVRRARLVRRVEAWDDRTLRLFASDCAEDALQYAAPESVDVLVAAIATARRHADGLATDDELAAARDAARAAAWAAAWAPATAAAEAAARAAAWAPATAAARAAARDAARAAAEAAAWAAEEAAARSAAWDAGWAAGWAAADAAGDAARAAARERYRARLAEVLGIEEESA